MAPARSSSLTPAARPASARYLPRKSGWATQLPSSQPTPPRRQPYRRRARGSGRACPQRRRAADPRGPAVRAPPRKTRRTPGAATTNPEPASSSAAATTAAAKSAGSFPEAPHTQRRLRYNRALLDSMQACFAKGNATATEEQWVTRIQLCSYELDEDLPPRTFEIIIRCRRQGTPATARRRRYVHADTLEALARPGPPPTHVQGGLKPQRRVGCRRR